MTDSIISIPMDVLSKIYPKLSGKMTDLYPEIYAELSEVLKKYL